MSNLRRFQASEAVTINPNSTAYAAKDLIGAKLTFTTLAPYIGGGGIIASATLADPAAQSAAVDVVLFTSNPSGTTFTDNAALDIADADLLKASHFSIAATDYSAFNDNSVATVKPVIGFKLNGTSVLYAALVSRGTPTYGTDNLTLRLEVIA